MHEAGAGTFSPDGKFIVTGGFLAPVTLWNAIDGTEVCDLQDHAPAVAIDGESRRLAIGTREGSIRVYEVRELAQNCDSRPIELQGVSGSRSLVFSLAFNPENNNQLAAGGSTGFGVLWDIEARESERYPFVKHEGTIFALAFSPDGQLIASASEDRTIRLTTLVDGESRTILRGHENGVWNVAFAPSVRQLASGSSDMSVRLWNVTPAISEPLDERSNNRSDLIELIQQHIPKVVHPDGELTDLQLDEDLLDIVR